MNFAQKYDRLGTGFLSGLILPVVTGLVIYLFSSHGMSLSAYLARIAESDVITHSISLSVFPNIFIFLLFNRFDMLRASRGVLAITIIWAILVFALKFFT